MVKAGFHLQTFNALHIYIKDCRKDCRGYGGFPGADEIVNKLLSPANLSTGRSGARQVLIPPAMGDYAMGDYARKWEGNQKSGPTPSAIAACLSHSR